MTEHTVLYLIDVDRTPDAALSALKADLAAVLRELYVQLEEAAIEWDVSQGAVISMQDADRRYDEARTTAKQIADTFVARLDSVVYGRGR